LARASWLDIVVSASVVAFRGVIGTGLRVRCAVGGLDGNMDPGSDSQGAYDLMLCLLGWMLEASTTTVAAPHRTPCAGPSTPKRDRMGSVCSRRLADPRPPHRHATALN
jgi:hypothetical protein